jgi:hypothetical protein
VTLEGGVRVPETAEWSASRYVNDISYLEAAVAPPDENGATTMTLRAWFRSGASWVEGDRVTLERTHGSVGGLECAPPVALPETSPRCVANALDL